MKTTDFVVCDNCKYKHERICERINIPLDQIGCISCAGFDADGENWFDEYMTDYGLEYFAGMVERHTLQT